MFEYFPDNYVWTLATTLPLNCGGSISEVDEACRPLKPYAKANNAAAQEAWYESWKKLAERVEKLALEHEVAGQYLSAGRKYRRACGYYLTAERVVNHRDPRRIQTYRQAMRAFKKAIQLRKEPVEFVEVPYMGSSLPALFIPGEGKGRRPCMIHFDGFDVMKEIIYLMVGDEFRRRGIGLLIVDHPGVGEALRERGLRSGPDTEVPAGASVDYLEKRPEVDPQKIGIMALSLGGYYAPRAAAFEKRLKCCVAWGGIWDFGELMSNFLGGRGEPSVPGMGEHAMWVFGKETLEEALAVAAKMKLEHKERVC